MKKKPLQKALTPDYPLVEITWGDAWADTEELSPQDFSRLTPVYRTTVGYLMNSDDVGYSLCSDVIEYKGEAVCQGTMYVPTGMIVSIRYLKRAQSKRPEPSEIYLDYLQE